MKLISATLDAIGRALAWFFVIVGALALVWPLVMLMFDPEFAEEIFWRSIGMGLIAVTLGSYALDRYRRP
jgi:hypothetical protein